MGRIKFNVEKCSNMHIGNKSLKMQSCTTIWEEENWMILQLVDWRDLWICVSADVWSPVSAGKEEEATDRPILDIISRTLYYKSLIISLQLIKCLVHPLIEYALNAVPACLVTWLTSHKNDIELLEKIKHRFTRMKQSILKRNIKKGLRNLIFRPWQKAGMKIIMTLVS